MDGINFYMKNVTAKESNFRNIENSFVSEFTKDNITYKSYMRYSKCTGLEAKGKPKNIYTESFPDSNELVVYMPSVVHRDSTDVVFTFLFIGEEKQKVYDNFYNYIKDSEIYYYDTKRLKKVKLLLLDAVTPTEDNYKGSINYLSADFKFKNIRGFSENCDENGATV